MFIIIIFCLINFFLSVYNIAYIPDTLKTFNSLDEIHSDEKGFAENTEYSFKRNKAAYADLYNVSLKISSLPANRGANNSGDCLSSPPPCKANRLPSIKSTETMTRGPSLNRIKVYSANRLVITTTYMKSTTKMIN